MAHIDRRDLMSGVLFVFFGGTVSALASRLPMGTARSMGPGYFPYYVGIVLVVVGLIVAVRALTSRTSSEIGMAPLSVIVPVVGSLVAFGLTVEKLGFIVAISLVVGVSGIAARALSARATAGLIAVLTFLVYVVFGLILGQPIKLAPSMTWMGG